LESSTSATERGCLGARRYGIRKRNRDPGDGGKLPDGARATAVRDRMLQALDEAEQGGPKPRLQRARLVGSTSNKSGEYR